MTLAAQAIARSVWVGEEVDEYAIGFILCPGQKHRDAVTLLGCHRGVNAVFWPLSMTIIPIEPHLPIGAVERETGLPKDTLRVWERRYGFPLPERNTLGERLYSSADVEKLRLIKRLIDQGHRPGKLIQATAEALSSLITPQTQRAHGPHCEHLIKLVRVEHVDALAAALRQDLLQQGLVRFVCATLAPLNALVGEAWARGDLQVHDEHLYTELVTNLLRAAIGAHQSLGGTPRLLLTTAPDEAHGLGLLMAESMMTSQGAMCVSLGTRTPLADIGRAAVDGRFNAVALSFSAHCSIRTTGETLLTLRQLLPEHIELWAGGAGVRKQHQTLAGVRTLQSLSGVEEAVRDWRRRHAN